MESSIDAYHMNDGSIKFVEKGQPQVVKMGYSKRSKEYYISLISCLQKNIETIDDSYHKESIQARIETLVQIMNELYPN